MPKEQILEILRDNVRLFLDFGEEPQVIAEAIVGLLPPLCDRRFAHAQVEQVYDARNSDLDRALPMDTGPLE